MFSKKPSVQEQQRPEAAKPVQSPLFDRPADRPAPGANLSQNSVQAKVSAQAGVPVPGLPARSAASAAGSAKTSSSITPPSPFEKEIGMTQQPPKSPAMPATPPFRTDFRPESRPDMSREPARRVDLSGVAAPRTTEADPVRKLIVGRDISLNGEINACDYLVVEGTVEARVREGKRIEITDTGLFRGTVEIEEADIAGRFEGDITVRGRLRVRSSGRIEGKVQYGELEIEAGGQLEGEIRGLSKPTPKPSEKTSEKSSERMQPVPQAQARVPEPAQQAAQPAPAEA